jgi:hypothetical protein
LALFSREPLFDAATTNWMFEVFRWSLENLDRELFRQYTPLVLPEDRFFPGRANSPREMAELVFGRVQEYAGLNHWACQVMDSGAMRTLPVLPTLPQPLRMSGAQTPAPDMEPLPILYDATLLNNPEALIGGFAQTLSWHLLRPFDVPGGEENRPHVAELVAVFLGFGVMMANSAYLSPKRSCGSCGGPSATRQSFLSQYHMTYALALFCQLKGLSGGEVKPHLKSSLRGHFKRAMKEIKGDQQRTPGLLEALG